MHFTTKRQLGNDLLAAASMPVPRWDWLRKQFEKGVSFFRCLSGRLGVECGAKCSQIDVCECQPGPVAIA